MMSPRRLVASLTAVVAAVFVAGAGSADTPRTYTHSTGIEVLLSAPATKGRLAPRLAADLNRAVRVSERHPTLFGYPFVDRHAKVVVLPVVAGHGGQARQWVSAVAREVAAPVRTSTVQGSRADLEALMDRYIGPQPEGVTVSSAYPEPAQGRIVLEVDTLDPVFLERVVADAGPDMVAVLQVDPAEGDGAPALGREEDRSPFYGGANVDGCTDAFAWNSGSVEMMLTAGHCYQDGGSVSTPKEAMGRVRSEVEENWKDGKGTVLMTDENTMRGDIALVRLGSGKRSVARIYDGAPETSASAPVAGKWSRSPLEGDKFCTGGRRSGERCGWEVVWDAPGNFYYGKTDETARRVWRGEKRGHCIRGGDSGGPVYTVNTRGEVIAKGVISGAKGFGGKDAYAGALDPPCVAVFTDIWDAYFSMPGDIS